MHVRLPKLSWAFSMNVQRALSRICSHFLTVHCASMVRRLPSVTLWLDMLPKTPRKRRPERRNARYAHNYQDARRSPQMGYGPQPCPHSVPHLLENFFLKAPSIKSRKRASQSSCGRLGRNRSCTCHCGTSAHSTALRMHFCRRVISIAIRVDEVPTGIRSRGHRCPGCTCSRLSYFFVFDCISW